MYVNCNLCIATYCCRYEHPRTGSCGLGRLDENFWKTEFGVDAVAAMPDVYPEFNSSCGRCYEIKCRGIQAISADGSVNLNRYDACFDTSKSVVIKIVDTCPCHGNEQWCCGDTNGETPSDKFTRTRLSDGRYRTSFMHLVRMCVFSAPMDAQIHVHVCIIMGTICAGFIQMGIREISISWCWNHRIACETSPMCEEVPRTLSK